MENAAPPGKRIHIDQKYINLLYIGGGLELTKTGIEWGVCLFDSKRELAAGKSLPLRTPWEPRCRLSDCLNLNESDSKIC